MISTEAFHPGLVPVDDMTELKAFELFCKNYGGSSANFRELIEKKSRRKAYDIQILYIQYSRNAHLLQVIMASRTQIKTVSHQFWASFMAFMVNSKIENTKTL